MNNIMGSALVALILFVGFNVIEEQMEETRAAIGLCFAAQHRGDN